MEKGADPRASVKWKEVISPKVPRNGTRRAYPERGFEELWGLRGGGSGRRVRGSPGLDSSGSTPSSLPGLGMDSDVPPPLERDTRSEASPQGKSLPSRILGLRCTRSRVPRVARVSRGAGAGVPYSREGGREGPLLSDCPLSSPTRAPSRPLGESTGPVHRRPGSTGRGAPWSRFPTEFSDPD